MEPSTDARSTLRFGVFEVDLRAGELRRHGTRVRLQDQPFRVLARLLSCPGQVVSREELRADIWPSDTFVDFHNGLSTAVNKVREALGDSAASPRYLETLPRRGYRFICPVERSPVPVPPADAPLVRRGVRLGVAGALIATALGAILLVVFDAGGLRTRVGGGATRVRSIAVLPFENLSGDADQEYFADGMTEALISQLAQAGSVRVISRTSVLQLKKTRKRIPQIARDLNVDTVVEGTVARSANRVRISVQLIDGTTDRHLWAGTYEGDLRDVLALQNQAALAIAREIQVELSPDDTRRIAAARALDAEAHDEYLRGRYLVNRGGPGDFKQALQYFEHATQISPGYASAHAALAHAYWMFAQPYAGAIPMRPRAALERSKAAALKAVSIDPELAEGRAILAYVKWLYDWDWRGAEEEFRRATRLNPNSVDAHNFFAVFLHAAGRHAEGMSELRRAIELDPLNLRLMTLRGELLAYEGKFDEAIREGQHVLALDPRHPRPHFYLAMAYEGIGQPVKAVAEHLAFLKAMGLSEEAAAALREAFETGGRIEFYRRWIQIAEETRKVKYVRASAVAELYARIGDDDAAFRCLEEAFAEHDSQLMFVADSPDLESLRSDARFANLLRRIRYPGPPQ